MCLLKIKKTSKPGTASTMSDTAAVEFRNVSKLFAGNIKAVDDVSLRIPQGRIVALLGPSGCGKTTTLRLINRLEEPTNGQVLVRGQNVRDQRPQWLRRSIGYVIQEGGLFPHWNVAGNVATVPRLLGWPRQRIAQRVEEVLRLVGLPEARFGRRMPAELSGGQRQRVGVARALAADPDVLLMDEPFGALDPGTREALQDEFKALHARLGKTVVLVTHDVAEAGRLADDIVLLDRGRIVQEGSLRELLLRPAGPAVRAFLGSRAQWLALEIVRVGEIAGELPAEAPSADSLRLPANLPLGEALVALANLGDAATVRLDGEGERTCSVKTLRTRILSDVKTAEESSC
jgi:osmoprotectant transport system ATP-binding protein